MARPTYGQLQEFQPETENVTAYLERMDMYLLANQTPEARQVPVFLSSVGGKTFALLRDLLAPSELKSQTLKTLYDTLKAHYTVKTFGLFQPTYGCLSCNHLLM